MAPARHLHVGDGRAAVHGRRRTAQLLRRSGRAGARPGRFPVHAADPAADARRRAVGRVQHHQHRRMDRPAGQRPASRRRRRAAAGPARTRARHPRRRRCDGTTAARRHRNRRLRPVRPAGHHQRRRAAVADGARPAAGRPAEADDHGRRRRIGVGCADDDRGDQGRRYPGRDLHPAVRHRRGVTRFHPGAEAGRGRRLAGPPGLRPARISGRRGEDRPHLPHHRRRALVDPGRQGTTAGRRPHRTARPRLGDHQLRRGEDLRRGGGTCGCQSPGRLRRDRRGPALGAVGQRGGGHRAVRRGQVSHRRGTR